MFGIPNLETLSLFKHPGRVVSMGRLGLQWYSSYFGAQKRSQALDSTRTDTDLDQRIAVDERAIYPYLFAGLYLTGSAGVLIDRLPDEQYERAVQAIQELIDSSEQVFLARPTRLESRLMLKHPLTQLLQSIDGPTNCFPSLHVALVNLAYQIFRQAPERDALVLPALKQAGIDICRATLATRQHSVVDVVGGIALSERVFCQHFSGTPEDLLSTILPELETSEHLELRAMIDANDELPALLDRLLERFK